jgi:3-phenylpropionate/trans-cinnamate dioxygenase ferredoxin subunit
VQEKERNWHLLALHENELQFANNNIAVLELEGKKICIARHSNSLYAFAFTCPHAGGLLANGYIDPLGNIVCPLHRYKYALKNGYNISGEGYRLKTWPVERRSNGIFIGLDKTASDESTAR